ncbi:TadE/TadG family type IV pilus assembly protein [Roseicyclus persicicus]|uniref:Pilus assembly protein n=1 Tax=Roseicyclus persicicus TaxID=2650661 RepID=A0A7X6GW07_9RHOB|nr:TadE/TadG family type IV pilus assembly protein [Roseibacterium persicicum]NKX43396.1 pilus assembly protein [Roseibacterium persicicum]
MLTRLLRRYWADTRAAVALETVIILPVLAWILVGSFVFFDAFRTYNSSIKATYAVADVLSRQTNTVFAYDIEGMQVIFDHLVRNSGDTRMRVTQINYSQPTDTYSVDWSYATNGEARLFTANLVDMDELFPVMANAERIILVETFIPYRPAFDIGLTLTTFRNFTFTRPRYAGQVPFDGSVTAPPVQVGS